MAADVGTTTAGTSQAPTQGGATPGAPPPEPSRRIRRQRSLPGGRAVVGALLVTAAAVTTFAAYMSATADPTTAYLVAADDLEPGTRLETTEEVMAAFGSVNTDLAEPLNERAIRVEDIESLAGRVLVSPLQRGDLLLRSALVDDGGVAPAQTMSIPIGRTDAVGGTLRPGERIDVLATHSGAGLEYTSYIVRGAPLLSITAPDGSPPGGATDLILTVAVSDMETVQALGHAINTAEIFVTRSSASPDDDTQAPGAFSPDPDAEGPTPDPAVPTGPLDDEEVGDESDDDGADEQDGSDEQDGTDDQDGTDEQDGNGDGNGDDGNGDDGNGDDGNGDDDNGDDDNGDDDNGDDGNGDDDNGDDD